MKKAYMIVDGQWGSTGKGLIAGYLALKRNPDVAVCNFGPNAGHTVVMNDGRKVMTQQIPSAIVNEGTSLLLLGPGSIIDANILQQEIIKYRDLLKFKAIIIHPSACVVHEDHKTMEKNQLNRISSTCKGTGMAQTCKTMRREGAIARDDKQLNCMEKVEVLKDPMQFTQLILKAQLLQIESAQGLELGINSGGFYPYCTSRDVTVPQIMADCGIPHGIVPEVIVSMRTLPIRVGDAYDPDGNQIGTSGPVYEDQSELSWDELGLEKEKTTVTGKIRRVFTWSWMNFDKVLAMLNPDAIFLNFVNYLDKDPSFESLLTKTRIEAMNRRSKKLLVKWIGTGPRIDDVIERPRSAAIVDQILNHKYEGFYI